MAQHYNPRLTGATSLIFYVDASNSKSYPGTGSIWTDISGNGNHFTLYNTPTYTTVASTGSYLTFNGTNQYARSANAINFSAYSAITLEIGFRTISTSQQIIYETTGTGGSTITGGISLLMNTNSTGTIANRYVSQWQGYGYRLFGFTPTAGGFNSVSEVFVNSTDPTGRNSYVDNVQLPYFTNTNITSVSTATTAGLSFANTYTYIASRNGTSYFYQGDIAWIRAFGYKAPASDITNNAYNNQSKYILNYNSSTISLITSDGASGPPSVASLTNTNSYTYTGANQSLTVPTGVTWLYVTANGAGGAGSGNGDMANAVGAPGGAGGRIIGWISVTSGETLSVIVGGGGSVVGSTVRSAGGGGGFSGVLRSTTHLISAGGGGGGTGGTIETPVVSTGVASKQGGQSTATSILSAAGGVAGSQDQGRAGTNGSGTGGGNGGTSTGDNGGSGGGGGFGTASGSAGGSSNGYIGGAGGFGGGGGGAGGGAGGTVQRNQPGGGGGGGYLGGEGGINTNTTPGRAGQGGWSFITTATDAGSSTTLYISNTVGGGGTAGAIAGAGGNGSVTIQWRA